MRRYKSATASPKRSASFSAQLRDHQDAQAARRHKIALLTAAALSYVASFFIFVYLWKPINDSEFNLVRWDWGQFLFGVWPLLLLFVVGLSVSWIEAPRRMWSSLSTQAPTYHYLAAALLVPTICLTAWFFYFRPKHAVYDEAPTSWAAYAPLSRERVGPSVDHLPARRHHGPVRTVRVEQRPSSVLHRVRWRCEAWATGGRRVQDALCRVLRKRSPSLRRV